MGNVLSSASARGRVDNFTSESEIMDKRSDSSEQNVEGEDPDITSDEARAKNKEEEMKEFKKQLSIKREQRKQILARHRAEKEELEKSLSREKQAQLHLHQTNKLLRELLISNNVEIPDNLTASGDDSDLYSTISRMKVEFEKLKENNNKLRKDLAESNYTLQKANADIADLNEQNTESIKQINALKEVVSVSKTMIALREQQLNELKEKLGEIEKSLADREASMLSSDLRQEYERQLQNIRTLRGLYEERARLAEVTRANLVRELDEQKVLYQAEVNKSKNLSDKVKELEDKIDELVEIVQNKNHQIRVCQDESLSIRAEMTVVNKLFSEVLLGYKSKNDLDKLAHRLEENHGILTQMAEREDDAEALTALPKLLLELVNQVDEGEENKESKYEEKESEVLLLEKLEENKEKTTTTTAEDIVQNLPKVWRVLMELLSHQTVIDENPAEKVTTCYKSVETKSGPVLVPSVSQTYIRLKDLIVEKLALIKEVNRMKQLNSHLETRLGEQERRLCMVTTELSKTWHVVGRLRRHHHQLHTHEKILKYELQQKRKLLNELKEELEYCREKWEQAREKNTQSEKDWRKLRAEFSSRKTKSGSPSFNNSGESGYSDERPSDESSESNDESEYVTEQPLRCKKKLKKSFETIHDSSTDFNLAAEREDPASDMLDVAELPLDTQDESHSENAKKNELVCEETEDELGDITVDSLIDEVPNIEINNENANFNSELQISSLVPTTASNTQCAVSPKESTENIVSQNKPVTDIDQPDEEIDNHIEVTKLKHCQEYIYPSNIHDFVNETVPNDKNSCSTDLNITDFNRVDTESTSKEQADISDVCNTINVPVSDNDNSSQYYGPDSTSSSVIDFKTILENVRKQNERLAVKDIRLKNLETESSKVINNLSDTLRVGEELSGRLDILNSSKASEGDIRLTSLEDNRQNAMMSADDQEPSTSTDNNHEARFAARDLRLKRLEEQTKSLVKKVNKTTSKGIKINYKLEELHNIYGSEGSRAGTPSEDYDEKDDKSLDEETQNEENYESK